MQAVTAGDGDFWLTCPEDRVLPQTEMCGDTEGLVRRLSPVQDWMVVQTLADLEKQGY